MKLLLLSLLLSLSSVFPFNNSLESSYLIPGGENIGVEIKPNGVVVIGGYDVVNKDISYNPSKDSDIVKPDTTGYIVNE